MKDKPKKETKPSRLPDLAWGNDEHDGNTNRELSLGHAHRIDRHFMTQMNLKGWPRSAQH